MPIGLVGRKCGMSRVFTETGDSVPVTVIEVLANKIVQIKSNSVDGYEALQVSSGSRAPSRVSRPLAGHYAKANVAPGERLTEFRLADNELGELKVGDELTVSRFQAGQAVDVQGISKGKGFAGGVKRHNFRMQRATHGNSLSHRALGSTGMCQTPGRVFKGKKMAGQLGNVKRTVQNQKILRIDEERHLILVSGAVPGAPGGEVIITASVKSKEDN